MTRAILLMLLVSFMVAGCGKRPRNLDPPPGTHVIYPKKYPPADQPGDRL